MTRYVDYSGGVDGVLFFEYVCDLCSKTIQLAEGEDLPNGWLWVGVKSDSGSTGHVCPSCRYAGATPKSVMDTLKLVKEQLRQTGGTASKVLTYKHALSENKHTARMVIADLELCTDKLGAAIFILEQLGH